MQEDTERRDHFTLLFDQLADLVAEPNATKRKKLLFQVRSTVRYWNPEAVKKRQAARDKAVRAYHKNFVESAEYLRNRA
jgi:hypothetical protein